MSAPAGAPTHALPRFSDAELARPREARRVATAADVEWAGPVLGERLVEGCERLHAFPRGLGRIG